MQPPIKSSTLYSGIFIAVVVGIIIGALSVSYSFYIYKEKLCILAAPRVVDVTFSQDQLQKVMSLQTSSSIFGKVLAKTAERVTVALSVENAPNATTTNMTIPFNVHTDTVFTLKRSSVAAASSTTISSKGSFDDIKVGASIWIRAEGDKKIFYLTPTR